MGRSIKKSLTLYSALLGEIKTRIRDAQNRAARAVNTELLRLYWDIGRLILARQKAEGWGAAVIPRLARDLHNELPEIKGFSERNIKLMMQFASEYPDLFSILQPPVAKLLPPHTAINDSSSSSKVIGQPPVAQLQSMAKNASFDPIHSIGQPLVAQLPWAHNIILIQMVKDLPTRFWYMRQSLQHGWSRALPAQLRSSLPTIEQIEAELASPRVSEKSPQRLHRHAAPRRKTRRPSPKGRKR